MTETTLNCLDDDAMVTAAQAGDESAFSSLVDRHRRELQVHCYRMMGSFADSEGKTALKDIEGGDAKKQFDAIWNYLLLGKDMKPPE